MNREDIIREVGELEEDLKAIKKSRDAIHERIVSLEDTPRHAEFVAWPAVVALVAVQTMAIVRCEGLIEDYRGSLEKMGTPDNIRKLNIVRRKSDDVLGS